MTIVSLADAKARLSALVEQAERGDPVCITRRGKAVAQISAIREPLKPVDESELRRLTDSMASRLEPTGEWMRQVRDEERY